MIDQNDMPYLTSLPQTHPHRVAASLLALLCTQNADLLDAGAKALNYHLARKPLRIPLTGNPAEPDDETDDVLYVTDVHGGLQEFAATRVTKGMPSAGPWVSFAAPDEERERVVDVLLAILAGRVPMPDAPMLLFPTKVHVHGEAPVTLPPEEPARVEDSLEQRRREVN